MANALGYVRRTDAAHDRTCRCDDCWRPATLADLNLTQDDAERHREALRDQIHESNEFLADTDWTNHGGSI